MIVTSPRGLSVPLTPTNKNTNWLDNKAAWLFYVILVLVSWVVVASWTDAGMAWTYVHIGHGLITYYLFHWNKGSPIQDDQGKYDKYVGCSSCCYCRGGAAAESLLLSPGGLVVCPAAAAPASPPPLTPPLPSASLLLAA